VESGAASEIVVVDDARRVLVATGDARAFETAGDAHLTVALGGVPSVVRAGDAVWWYGPLHAGGRMAGALRVRMPAEAAIAQALRDARALLVGITLFDGGLVLLFGALFIRRVVEPIEALSASARRVAAGELDVAPQAALATRDEVAHLVDDFNRMTASLRRQREQMVAQEKLVTVGRLAAGVAHEVGNPLAAVLGYVDLLLHDEPADGERREPLERIRKETDRIRGIVADLLEYSRPLQGSVEAVRVGDAVEVALSLVRPQPRFGEVEVVRELRDDVPAVAAAQNRLVQVLLNLLLNAAQALPEDTSSTNEVSVRVEHDDDFVWVVVKDTGLGMTEDVKKRIFDPFFTTKPKGIGMGLSISRGIIEAHGGHLWGENNPIIGATFRLTLPVAK